MKKRVNIFLLLLLPTGILISCKKDNTAKPKDYSASVKDKTWWGQMTYSGKTAEYYSVHFKADGTLLWSQFSGEYEGRWVVKDKQLVMNFNVSGAEVKADISDDEKLVNITDNTGAYNVNGGQIISTPNLSLSNTRWKGTFDISSYQLSFLDDSKLNEKFLTSGNENLCPYTRSASGAAIRYNRGSIKFLAIITSDNIIRGNSSSNYLIEVVKQ
jgi:hypothetical protein